jgi:Tol biopolymer transport system component
MFQNWFGNWPSFSASETGVLTFAIAEHPQSQFQWTDRNGRLLESVGEPGPYMSFDLTPDGRRLVFSRGEGRLASLWTLDLVRGVTSRLTFGTSSSYYDPRWASDGQWLAANRPTPPPPTIFKVLSDGREVAVPAVGNEICILDDVSHDGRVLLCRTHTARDLMAVSLDRPREPVLVRKAPTGMIDQPQFSPDGRWILYNADESGRHEVYLTPFPATGQRWQVSADGGVQPVWRQDGSELYYLRLDGVLMAVALKSGDPRQFSRPNRLFDTGLAAPSPWVEQYAASADGQRFLILKPENNTVRNSVGVILNWPALMQTSKPR